MLGGPSDAPIDDRTNEIATFAVEQLKHGKANFAIQGNLQLAKVVSAKRQVVSGTNHILVVEAADDAGPKTLEVTVWEKLQCNVKENEAPMELTHFKMVGPAAEAGGDEWSKAAQQGVAQLNQRSNSLFPYQLLRVLSATPSNDGSSNTELLVEVKKGEKEEKFALTVKPAADAHFHLVKFSQHAAEGAAT
ncbi:hypothetical protein COO60DRAFT_1634990 [Scenedesmus sp. NREL 46B-D3]|nr:hypothetical protein COO60DRAFT_1634990 [Scenedesmus sp. NREL 46B-D3]